MSVSKNHSLPKDLETATAEDLSGLSRREKLQKLPVSRLNGLRNEGETETLRSIESALQEEAEEILTEEIGLEDYLPPSKFIVPKPETESLGAAYLQRDHGSGPESATYRSDVNSVIISTDFGLFNGVFDGDVLSTSFHELIHNDTYNRLTGADEVLHADQISNLNRQIEDISLLDVSDTANELLDRESKDSIIDEVSREYKISNFELTQLSESARDKIADLSKKYNSSRHDRGEIIEEAYEVVQDDIDVYHLNSLETQPEKEAFAWLGTMYLEGDLEVEREHLDTGFPDYDKEEEIQDELEGLIGVYDNLTEHGDMESEEALNYILEEVQPRKFDYKASKIRESLEN